MNKSILKHEIKSMKWMSLLSIVGSLIVVFMFSIDLDNRYGAIFHNGLIENRPIIQESFRYVTSTILVIFLVIAVMQVFMQFRAEKDQEVGRFLKSLPVKNEEFFKVKLIAGIGNFTIAFLVLLVGIIVVRNSNMFWIEDIYSISIASAPFIELDGVLSILKEIGLIYLIVLSFYTFLIMIQYTFTNIIGGIVTGILVWLAPAFILISSVSIFERFFSSSLLGAISTMAEWTMPWLYPFQFSYNDFFTNYNYLDISPMILIDHLGIKYIICIGLILVNIILAYKLNKASKIEDENKVITFKTTRNIFKFGVTICSALLVAAIATEFLMINVPNIVYIVVIILGGAVGYIVSKKITQVGN